MKFQDLNGFTQSIVTCGKSFGTDDEAEKEDFILCLVDAIAYTTHQIAIAEGKSFEDMSAVVAAMFFERMTEWQ
jgi:hypothetical protein